MAVLNLRSILPAAIAAAMLATPASADFGPPPAEYAGPYTGELHIIQVPPLEVRRMCWDRPGQLAHAGKLGCAIVQPEHDHCTIIAADRILHGVSPERIIRHEIGHCKGWAADHPR